LRQRRDEAYVLRTQSLGEADLIVSLLVQHHGAVRGVARAARKSRKRFGGLLEPMTHVRAEWTEREGRELHRIDTLEGLRSFAAMQSDPLRQAVCAVLSEVSEAFAREGQELQREFRLLGATLAALESGADPCSALRYFEFWTLQLHGLFPGLEVCSQCGKALSNRESLRVGPHGDLRCRLCDASGSGRSKPLGAGARRFLEQARRESPGKIAVHSSVTRPGGSLESLLRGTLEQFAERRFRAYRHLKPAIDAEVAGGGTS
jgi:DNA repair protein RecO (recombination protein O)